MTSSGRAHNLLELLGVASREDVITNLLAHSYNTSQLFRSNFLRAVGVPSHTEAPSGTAHTRVSTGDTGVPDLVIVDPYGTGRTLIIIENKLTAEEGKDQTARYSSADCLTRLAARFGLSVRSLQPHYVLLTLFPDVHPTAQAFTSATYESLLRQEWAFSPEDSSWVPELMRAWLSILSRFYTTAALRPDDQLLDRLRANDCLDGSFLAFRSFIRSIRRPTGLSYLWSSRSSQQGRRFYFAQFGKPTWQPSGIDRSKPKWRLDPQTCYNIHVEPQFNVLSGSFAIYLHYETNPYLPRKKASANLHPPDYRAYLARRSRFISAFERVCPTGIKCGGRSNQVAKATLSLERLSVQESSRRISYLLSAISGAVDKTLEDIDAA